MRVRGERECRDCGEQWSYYETGEVTCPSCGSLRSTGLDEPATHTASQDSLDLTPARNALEQDHPLDDALHVAGELCREYLRTVGFVSGGRLEPLDETVLAAAELRHAADIVGRSFAPDETEEVYVVSLLSGADSGDRPAPPAVPDTLRSARGLGAADMVDQYRRAIRRGTAEPDSSSRDLLAAIDEQTRRIRALQGDVDPATVERLIEATRDLGAAIADGDDRDLARARDRLDRLP